MVDHLKKYLDICIGKGTLTLKVLTQIEEKLASDFDFPEFSALGFGSFIEFLLKEAKQVRF